MSETHLRVPPSHARAISAHLKIIEEHCRVIERWLDGFQGIFYESSQDIPRETRVELRDILTAIFEHLRQIQRDLRLHKEEINPSKLIDAYTSGIWVALAETKSRQLNAYGLVPEELSSYLDPRLNQIDSLVSVMRSLVEKSKAKEKEYRSKDATS